MDNTPILIPSQAQNQQHRPIRRAKTFSGCMTCRSRHLKCDEARPGCRRCLNSQLECSGYPGYRARVQWRPVRGPSNFKTTSHFSDMSRTLTLRSETGRSSGGSAVICSLPSTPSHSYHPPLPSPRTDSPQLDISSEHVDVRSVISREQSSPSNGDHPQLSPISYAAPQDLSGHVDSDHAERDLESGSNFSHRNAPRLPACLDLGYDDRTVCIAQTHLDLLGTLHLQPQLIEHWVNHLSDALMPVPGASNPLKSVFVPIANAGALCSALESSGSVALFYLICSASAFHLSANTQDTGQQSEFMTLALSHHSQGIRHLQHSLAKDDPSQRESLLASLLMCLIYEPATVEPNFWLTHLRGAAQWLRKINISDLTRTESAAILYQTLIGAAIFLRSQILSEDLAQDGSFHFNLKAMSGRYYLHQIFGLSRETLEAVSDVIAMAATLRRHQCDGPDSHSGISAPSLDRMEIELYLAIPQGLITTETTQTQNDLPRHYSWIFYFSLLIYFKRTVRNSPPEEVQSLVEQSLDHIEVLRNCTSRPFSPVVWPIAVTFLEAQDSILQKRAMIWLDFIIERSALSIWQKARPLFCSFWAQRKVHGRADMQWDEFLSDPSNPSIMLV